MCSVISLAEISEEQPSTHLPARPQLVTLRDALNTYLRMQDPSPTFEFRIATRTHTGHCPIDTSCVQKFHYVPGRPQEDHHWVMCMPNNILSGLPWRHPDRDRYNQPPSEYRRWGDGKLSSLLGHFISNLLGAHVRFAFHAYRYVSGRESAGNVLQAQITGETGLHSSVHPTQLTYSDLKTLDGIEGTSDSDFTFAMLPIVRSARDALHTRS